MSMAASTYKQ